MVGSIRSRFVVSLVANILRSGITFATGLLLARWMGPSDYGRMTFLLASFMAFRQILDMGSSTAFFTLLSQRQRGFRFVATFGIWVGIQFVIAVVAVVWLLPESTVQGLWLGESRLILALALVATFMQGTVWNLASQMAEASRETIKVQKLNTLVVFIHLAVVCALWQFGRLAISLIFAAISIEWLLASLLAAKMYFGRGRENCALQGKVDTVLSVSKEFMRYCLPMIPYTFLSFVHDFADRWMLQNWGGSTEQAYYGVAQQFAAIALLATSSILRIFWKEIAEAYHKGDLQRVESLYARVSRMLYFVGAVIAGGLLPWAGEILRLTVGEAYLNGEATLMLMFLYPVHQSMGQIGGTMLYATGHIRAQAALGMGFMITSLVIAYFMLAPANAPVPGFALASRGLAWKMVLLQVIGVNVTAWFVAYLFKWKFDWFYQLAGLLSCTGAGAIAYFVSTYLFSGVFSSSVIMPFSAILYGLIVMALIYSMPWLGGLSRTELLGCFRKNPFAGIR